MSEKNSLIKWAAAGVRAEIAKSAETAAEQRDAAAERQAAARAEAATRRAEAVAAGLYEYRVEQVRETLIGDKIKTDGLAELLNRVANDGWQLKSVTSASVTGRVGPGGSAGLLIVFERRIRA